MSSFLKQMNSLTETLAHWGGGTVLRPIAGGHINSAFLVQMGNEYRVLKSTTQTEASVRWIANVQAVAQEIGLVVPEIIPAKDGQLVVSGMTLEPWINGQSASKRDRQELAPQLAEFHRLTRGWPQRPRFASSLELLETDRGGDINLAQMPHCVVERCRHRWQDLAGQPQSVIHGDLALENVLKTAGGRYALIDWDEARVDVSLLDTVGLFEENPGYSWDTWTRAECALDAWEVAVSWQREPAYARNLARSTLRLAV